VRAGAVAEVTRDWSRALIARDKVPRSGCKLGSGGGGGGGGGCL